MRLGATKRAVETDMLGYDHEEARADAAGDANAPLRFARPHTSPQPVGRIVGQPHRLVLVLVRNHDQHRAENLLLSDTHLVVDVGEEGGPTPTGSRRPTPLTAPLGSSRPSHPNDRAAPANAS